MIAEYERAGILERGRRGRRHAGAARHAARSGSVGALRAAPFGYPATTSAGPRAAAGVARLEVVEEEAPASSGG